MTQSKFIVFEGLDGSGKSTQIHAVSEALTARGISNVCTAEPFEGCETGRLIRRILKHEVEFPGQECMIHLFAAAEKYHVEHVIKPALAQGRTVLCDRYMYSTYAYNVESIAQAERTIQLHQDISILPDTIIWLNISVQEALLRINEGRVTKEFYEKADVLLQVQKRYEAMFSTPTQRYSLYAPILAGLSIVEVNATQTVQQVTNYIVHKIFHKYFPEKL